MIGLLVFLLVVAMAAAGVVVTRWQNNETYGFDEATPSVVTTPTVAPLPGGAAAEPEPPASSAQGVVDPATGEWLLPEWSWDVLPVLAPGQEEAWQTMQSPRLAAMAPPSIAGCDMPHTIDDDASYQEAVTRQWECVHEAWTPVFERLGWSTVEPPLRFFTGIGSTSACGYAEAPAFYCPDGGGMAFFGGDDRDLAMYWDLTVNESVHHEYAHHIQNLAGIIDAMEGVDPTDDLDRRLELQATCLSASMTFHNDAVGFDQSRWDDWQYSLHESVLDDEHGSRESLLYWGTRGLYADTVGDCNTWSVDPARVN
ncbi:hypothetical protein EAX62_13990 [Tessaracoccus antarcticus]|uniref:Neutral zinc metallopeptidase n=1 Tax=Tessaracoccus antarcticus TaxID=2479848 RepID=A0A3M0GLY1_9ACTN|nr:hypothetical protein EAX62_13990 [Tessaracoccus antarcticus]